MDSKLGKRYGWKKQLPDHRDKLFLVPEHTKVLPAFVDLRPQMPSVYDQGALGSCTANALAGAIQYDEMREGRQTQAPSRLFIYFNERLLEGTTNSDSGATIRDSIRSINKWGYCPESSWPYNIQAFATTPPQTCYQSAKSDVVRNYGSVPQALNVMQNVLANGYPFVGGISVYESFENPDVVKSGMVPMPGANESLLGGHAICFCGYANDGFYFRNSWGPSYGMEGYGWIPNAYLLNHNLSGDFWVVTFAP